MHVKVSPFDVATNNLKHPILDPEILHGDGTAN